jgi:recombinational DNA repair protein RecR
VNGYIDIPFQVIITGELRGEEYAAYRALTDKADEADVERIIEGVGKEKDDVLRGHYRVLLQLIIEKNPQFIEKVRRDSEMEDVLMEIVKDRVDEQVSAGKREQEQQTTVTHINDIMKNLKLTVEQAMDALSIPQSQRSTYAALVG